ncbi:MAG TPA: DUF2332 domain-containing protein [Actinophytocola sp.]|uniref:DUF2332 domain-containing protein n=1 Tax=Actinophytocola sp. TaxID=1872138 RepID=UPI002DB74C22|nr:DUF2332 domain-containing protein [Actinophytocola sp.]HEU5469633.1 DUF2332 domain-containing protein [Actinophytocola sp.]
MAAAELVDLVQRRLRRFAEVDAVPVSPLYAHLAERSAEDPEIYQLLTAAPAEFAHATLLFAAVHRVLQANPIHELANYYPSLGGNYGVDGATWPLFRTFVLERADAIRDLIARHTTQTNEVRRAALLYPAVARAAAGRPIGLVEVGCSGGLLLGLDRYGYRYQTEQSGPVVAGPARARVGLHCALELAEGATLPAIPKTIQVRARVGLDRSPIDLSDEDQYAWLEACVWPDQPERLRLLAAAAAVQRADPPELITGDAIDDLPAAVARIPTELPVVLITSVAMHYLPTDRQHAFQATLSDLAAARDLTWVSHEEYAAGLAHLLPDRPATLQRAKGEPSFGVLGLVRWTAGQAHARPLARTAWHGQRMTWLP